MINLIKQNLIIALLIVVGATGLFVNQKMFPAQAQSESSTYGVVMNDSTGELSGFAWSSNLGWIKFGGLSGWPTGGGTTPSNAKIEFGKLVGWARACAATVGGDCSTMISRTGGWDGWISLDGGSKYSISVTGNDFSGYAWGSNVVGWVDFSKVKLTSAIAGFVTANITAASSSIASGTATTISWTSTGAESCSFKQGEAVINPSSATSGAFVTDPLLEDTTFFVTCVNSDASASGTDHVTVYINGSENKPKEENDCNNPDGCEIIWDEDTPADCTYDPSTDTFSCVDPNNPGSIMTFVIPPTHRSTCTPSQQFVNRTTTWTLTNPETANGGTIGAVNWKGTSIPSTVTSGTSIDKFYTTVGIKNVIAVTRITPVLDEPYISACYATTSIKLDTGGGGEI